MTRGPLGRRRVKRPGGVVRFDNGRGAHTRTDPAYIPMIWYPEST